MEFKYHDGQDQRTSLPTPCPFSTVAYINSDISRPSLQGSVFAPSSFPSNVSVPRVFPMSLPINAEEAFRQEQIQLELQKEEIRREIIAGEMALGRRRELEEEVRREMVAERTVEIPKEKKEGLSFGEQVSFNSAFLNHRMNNPVNNIDGFGVPQSQLPHQVDIRQPYMHTNTNNKGKVIIWAKPDVDCYGTKRKAVRPSTIDDSKSLPKKSKMQWSCGLCQISTSSEKGLNDHLEGKKHKAKAASRRRGNR